MLIELKTLFIVYIILTLLGIVVISLLWLPGKKRVPGIGLWFIGYTIQLVALSLITLRDVIPDIFSIVFANTLLVAGMVTIYKGLKRFAEKKSRSFHNFLMLAVFLFLHIYFTYIYPSIAFRNINISAALLYVSAQGSWLMLRRAPQGLKSAYRAVGIVLFMFCLVSVTRIVYNAVHLQIIHLFLSGSLNAITILAQEILFTALTFSLILLVNRRLMSALEDELQKQRQTEDSLRESRERFQGLVETLYEWVWEADQDGRYIYVSPQVKNIIGYEPSEIIGKTINEFMPPDEARRVSGILNNIIKEEKPIDALENKYIHKNGQLLVIETNGRPFYDANGKLKGYRGTDSDITRRKEAEEELQKNRRFLSELIERSGTIICIKDLNGCYELVNKKWEEESGFERQYALGKTDEELFPHDLAQSFRTSDLEVIKYGITKELEVNADGIRGRRHVLNVVFPVRDDEGRITGVCAIATDITNLKQIEEELSRSRRFLSELIEHSGTDICFKNIDGRYTLVNRKWEEDSGFNRRNVLGKTDEELFPEELAKQIRADDMEAMESGIAKEKELSIDGPNGKKYYLMIIFPLKDDDARVNGICSIGTEITARKHAEELLASERQRLAYILEGTNVGTWEWNVQTGEIIFNERWAEMIGYTLAELAPVSIGTWTKFAHPEDLKTSTDLIEKHFKNELPYYECELRMHHKNGDWIWVLDRGKVATWTDDGKPLFMYGTHQEITERKLDEEKIRHMATHDTLTGLPAMKLARDRLSSAMGIARRHKNIIAVMFVDLDGFKDVNDTMGHDAGDSLLKQVAKQLLSSVRETDTVARIGGDEFLIIATGLHSRDDSAQIARKAIRYVSQPVDINGRQAQVSISIGISLYPLQGEDMDQLIKLADQAMYRVKATGKNNYAYADKQ